jgi:hypothetical protein
LLETDDFDIAVIGLGLQAQPLQTYRQKYRFTIMKKRSLHKLKKACGASFIGCSKGFALSYHPNNPIFFNTSVIGRYYL